MVSILQSLSKTIHLSIVLAILLFIGLFFAGGDWAFDQLFWSWLFRYFHVVAGVMWIGLLWYFNLLNNYFLIISSKNVANTTFQI